jgi:hypothetical protein
MEMRQKSELIWVCISCSSAYLIHCYFCSTTEVAFYPIMTRQEDGMFSSFINCIVLSTFYASSEGMDEKDSYLMPLISLFGNDMFWSLKDAISANGNYDEIYSSNFNNVENRGRNALNTDQMPELLDMPGLQA